MNLLESSVITTTTTIVVALETVQTKRRVITYVGNLTRITVTMARTANLSINALTVGHQITPMLIAKRDQRNKDRTAQVQMTRSKQSIPAAQSHYTYVTLLTNFRKRDTNV